MPLVALGFLDFFLIPEVLLLSSHLKLSSPPLLTDRLQERNTFTNQPGLGILTLA